MDIRLPTVGESVVEALLAKWYRNNGDLVHKDDALCEIETDKITMDIYADSAGRLTILSAAGTVLPVGSVIGQISEGAVPEVDHESAPVVAIAAFGKPDASTSPVVRQVLRERGLAVEQVTGSGSGGRILLSDLHGVTASNPAEQDSRSQSQSMMIRSEELPVYQSHSVPTNSQPLSGEERVRMSPLRKRIAERLLQARQQTAMLTTFNEVDLGVLQMLRARRKQDNDPIGLLPFFVRATVEALRAYPAVNARIDGDEMVYHHFYHLGIAVSTEKGLVVPVLRDADTLPLRQIDAAIALFVEKIKTNRLAIADLEGGTFTVSNGGTYGSLLSTPIINPPQSGVLGMHAILERAVVRDGQITIRPMMYLALSYDHRIIDGREAVGFLKMLKERLEDGSWLEGLL